jgi:hypothetical protein
MLQYLEILHIKGNQKQVDIESYYKIDYNKREDGEVHKVNAKRAGLLIEEKKINYKDQTEYKIHKSHKKALL